MKKTCLLLTFATLAACDAPPDDVEQQSADLTSGKDIPCQTLKITKGSIGSGQSVAGLKAAESPTSADADWTKYVEFAPASTAECTFPLDAVPSKLTLRASYKGPLKSDMTWTFQAWDYSASAWVAVTDNTKAGDWTWTTLSADLPAPLGRFISGGLAKTRYFTTSTLDASDLDLWALNPTVGTTPPPPTVWKPTPGTTWHWQLQGAISTSVPAQVYDIDLFSSSAALIADLHSKGKKVICYFSAGTRENWRPDASKFPSGSYGKAVEGWAGENWVDTNSVDVRNVMKARLDQAVTKKCDGVEPDNVDGFEPEDSDHPVSKTGFMLTAATQITYNTFLATEAHKRGLSVGLKNDVGQVKALEPSFDWALNESCLEWGEPGVAIGECGNLKPFITANKAVFHAEYRGGKIYDGRAISTSTVCPLTKPLHFSSLVLDMALDGKYRGVCPN
jgi:hypothetical protein